MDPVLLSRIQFGLTVGFHFLFVPVSIGLAWFLVIWEGIVWKTGNASYERVARLFARLLGLTFVVGVSTGLVMIFQFGTNWGRYSNFVGSIFGAPLAAEAVFAFFLESAFIGLYLFGRNRVSKAFHWFSIFMVGIGTCISAFCILVANSWMQTPAGYRIENGKAVLDNFYDVVFNPSMWARFLHTVDGALVTGALFVAGICAYILYFNKNRPGVVAALKLSISFGFIVSFLQLFPFGHFSAREVARYQPEKSAAMEGLYHSETGAPLVLFGIPGTKDNRPRLEDTIEIPGMLSWLAFGSRDAEVKGVDAFPKEDLPPLKTVFIAFHLMVALGCLFIFMMGLGLFLRYKKKLLNRYYLWGLMACAPLGVIVHQLGWICAEVGRQPWVVYKLLRTQDATSEILKTPEIIFSIVMFVLIFSLIIGSYLYYLSKYVKAFAEEDHSNI